MNCKRTHTLIHTESIFGFRYFQFDSWWYYKGQGDGVKEWEPRPDIFPHGARSVVVFCYFRSHNGSNDGWSIENLFFSSSNFSDHLLRNLDYLLLCITDFGKSIAHFIMGKIECAKNQQSQNEEYFHFGLKVIPQH